jgi:hypothetical protein
MYTCIHASKLIYGTGTAYVITYAGCWLVGRAILPVKGRCPGGVTRR